MIAHIKAVAKAITEARQKLFDDQCFSQRTHDKEAAKAAMREMLRLMLEQERNGIERAFLIRYAKEHGLDGGDQ